MRRRRSRQLPLVDRGHFGPWAGRHLIGSRQRSAVLALYYGLAEADRAQGALAYVEDYLSDEKFFGTAHLKLYFHFWAPDVLYGHGRVELAVSAPRTLRARIAPEGPLANIPVRATVRKR